MQHQGPGAKDVVTADLIATGLPIGVRAGEAGTDAIDGVVAARVLEPETAGAVAACLAWASRHGLVLVVRGAGTKREWGRPPQRVDAILSMRRLDRILSHQHGDLTVSVEAGVPLSDLNRILAERRQQLPLDPPFADRATIGGLLATNDSGPLRHRYGTPRDLVIGVELATADGRLAKAGGQVVKNVAGYDLSKLISGSFGALAVIVSATFKLLPLPAASRTVSVEAPDAGALQAAVMAITSSQLEPAACELHVRWDGGVESARPRLLLRFASLPAAVDAQGAEACARLSALGLVPRLTRDADEQSIWDEHARVFMAGPGAVVRASWLPADLTAALAAIVRAAGDESVEVTGRAAVGAGLIRIEGTTAAQAYAIDTLRRSAAVGNVVVVRGTPGLKGKVDVWPPREAAAVLDAVKRAMDPTGVLGAGRGA